MKILGLDIGTKRIGVSISDALGITAQGVTVLRRETDQKVMDFLKDIVLKEGVREIVIGLPLNMDGSTGPKAQEAIDFADWVRAGLNISVKLWDERMTTMEVERLMIEADTSRSKRRKKIDKLAAQVILQGYLDSIKSRETYEQD